MPTALKKTGILFLAVLFIFAPLVFAESNRLHYYKGLDLYHAGKYEDAVTAFKAQLDKTHDDQVVRRWLKLAQKRVSEQDGSSDAEPIKAPETNIQVAKSQTSPSSVVPPLPVAPKVIQTVTKAEPPVVPQPTPLIRDDYENGISYYMDARYSEAQQAFGRYLKENPGHVAAEQWVAMIDALVDHPKDDAVPQNNFEVKNTSAGKDQTTADVNQEEIERLRQQLKQSEAMAERAIAQTKKALSMSQAQSGPFTVAPDDTTLSRELESLRASRNDLIKELKDRNIAFAKLERQEKQGQNDIQNLRHELETAKAVRASIDRSNLLKEQLADVENRIEILRQEKTVLSEELISTKKTLEQFSDLYRKAEENRKELESQLEHMREETQALKKRTTTNQDSERQIQRMTQEITSLNREQNSLKTEAITLRKANETLTERLNAKESMVISAHADIDQLRAAYDREKAASGSDNAKLTKLLEESRAQGLRFATNLREATQNQSQLRTQLAVKEQSLAELRTQLLDMKDQLNLALPQLQNMRSLLNSFQNELSTNDE